MLHIRKIKPLNTSIITTGEKYSSDIKDNGIITANKGDLKLYQKVIAVGPMVRNIQVGDTVMIDPFAYAVRRFDKNSIQNDIDNNPILEYKFNWITIDDVEGNPQDCLFLTEHDIQFVFEGEETSDTIITSSKPKIIMN